MAERLAVAYAETCGYGALTASSAGTRAAIGRPIHDEAASVLKDFGADPGGFVARQLTPKMIMAADLILTMTNDHRDSVLMATPQKFKSTFTLCEASRLVTLLGARTVADLPILRSQLDATEKVDVTDPIGKPATVFEAVGQYIADLLLPIVDMCRSSA